MTVSNEDRDALATKLRDSKCIYDERGDLDTPSKAEARLIAGVVVSHGWGPTAELRDDRDQLAKALLTVLYELHPIGGSTSRTGIGGAAVTTFCDIVNPINIAAEELRDTVESVLRRQLHRMEREGYSHDSVELREAIDGTE